MYVYDKSSLLFKENSILIFMMCLNCFATEIFIKFCNIESVHYTYLNECISNIQARWNGRDGS